jgi:glycosyltransferase involved in cell wall biosynthesis
VRAGATIERLTRFLGRRRGLLRGPQWPYARSWGRHLWRRVAGQRPLPVHDLVFVVHSWWEPWILHGICREIEHHSRLRCAFHPWPGDTLPPPARAAFVSHYSLFPSLLKADPSLWSVPTLVLYTHPDDHGVPEDELFWALRQATAVVTICTMFREHVISRGVRPDRAAAVLGGADPAIFLPHRRGSGVVGFCSAYYPRKGPDRVLAVARALPHRRILLVGRHWDDYPRWTELRALPNLSYVEAEYAEYPALYRQMDVFVSPSMLEGGPIPLLEAMMSNAVPVASRTGFAPDLVRHGDNGFLFDVDAPSDTVSALVERAFTLRADVSATVAHLSWARFTRELLSLLPAGTFRASRTDR